MGDEEDEFQLNLDDDIGRDLAVIKTQKNAPSPLEISLLERIVANQYELSQKVQASLMREHDRARDRLFWEKQGTRVGYFFSAMIVTLFGCLVTYWLGLWGKHS